MTRKPNTKCEICDKPLYRRPSEIKKAEHLCCKGCRSTLYKKFKNYYAAGLKKGMAWNKGMSKSKGDTLSYGRPRSKETKNNISKALKAVLIKSGEFRICPICGGEFYVYPSNVKRGNGKFCSKRCATIANNLVQKDHDTDIELIIEGWLVRNNIKHEKQKNIEGVSIPDFFIEPNICIYADGDYWHGLEKVKKRDKWINGQLKGRGYNVIRILGSAIKSGVRPNELL